jgi:DNA-binding NarL/FixJ family response regulator
VGKEHDGDTNPHATVILRRHHVLMQNTIGIQMSRILLIDECTIYRKGLRGLLEKAIADAEVLEARSLPQALPLIKNERCDLILVDLVISRFQSSASPIAACVASPARWAVISATDSRSDILASLAAGFHGFISKHQSEEELLGAINDLLSGRIYVPSSLAERGGGDSHVTPLKGDPLVTSINATPLSLSDRQRDVLCLLARGMSNKEIADSLQIAESTTKIHTAAVLRALGVRNRTEAAVRAIEFIRTANAPTFNPDSLN